MKTVLVWLVVAILLASAVYGWRRYQRDQAEDKPPSAVQQVVDGATGRTAVRAFIDTKAKLQDIDDNQRRRLELETP